MGYTSKESRLKYKKENYSEQDRLDMNKRKRDRYHYEKKNGKIPANKELDHTNGINGKKVRVISKSLNRSKGAKKTNAIRRG